MYLEICGSFQGLPIHITLSAMCKTCQCPYFILMIWLTTDYTWSYFIETCRYYVHLARFYCWTVSGPKWPAKRNIHEPPDRIWLVYFVFGNLWFISRVALHTTLSAMCKTFPHVHSLYLFMIWLPRDNRWYILSTAICLETHRATCVYFGFKIFLDSLWPLFIGCQKKKDNHWDKTMLIKFVL